MQGAACAGKLVHAIDGVKADGGRAKAVKNWNKV